MNNFNNMFFFINILINKVKKYYIYFFKRKKNVVYNLSVFIGPNSTFEGANSIGERSFFDGSMGYGSYLGYDCYITGKIGRFTSISNEVKCNLGVHPYKPPYVSTSPMFFSLLNQSGLTFAKKQLFSEVKPPIKIGNDCWIGQRVFIAGGISISDGAVVLTGAVVVKDVPPYSIVGGVPAKIIGYRYEQETINELLRIKWWDMPIDWLKVNYELFSDINRFLLEVKRYKYTDG